jgi:exopolysaccharide biosynthesis protein
MLRILNLNLVLLLSLFITVESLAGEHVAYDKRWLRGVPVNIVTADLNDPSVKISPAMARYGAGTSEGFGSMLSRLQPTAAITGTYFCVKQLIPVGDIIIDGSLVNYGSIGIGICVTPDKRVEFKSIKEGRKTNWAGYSCVICSGPMLVKDGVAGVARGADGFRDRSLYRPAQRSALGVTKYNKLLLVTVNRPIYLNKLALIMKDLGAVNAINLDGGSSTALHYDGKTLSHPGRRMTNLLVVYESAARFAKIKPQLAPALIVASKSSRS